MVLFMPGFPSGIKMFLGLATGAAIIFVASRIKPDMRPGQPSSMPYVESKKPSTPGPSAISKAIPAATAHSTPPVINPEDTQTS